MRQLRRSGPGGQHRNKVQTAISLHHLPTGVRAEASERRNQSQNRTVALFRLRVNLALHVRRACSSDLVPSMLWQSRCTSGVLKVGGSHDDFPSVLAEALDVLAALGCGSETGRGIAALHAVATGAAAEDRFTRLGPGQSVAERPSTPRPALAGEKRHFVRPSPCVGRGLLPALRQGMQFGDHADGARGKSGQVERSPLQQSDTKTLRTRRRRLPACRRL